MRPLHESDDQVLFLHIPKTAGTSFTQILKALYPASDIFLEMDIEALKNHLAAGYSNRRLFIGHYSHEAVDLFRQRPRLLTFLREPRERIISHYYHYRRQSDDAVAALPDRDKRLVDLIRQYDFTDFISLDLPEVEQGFANVHTRQLAHSTSDPVPQSHRERQALLESALTHLGTLDFIGMVERFDESLALFSRLFGTEVGIQAVRANVNEGRPHGSADRAVFDHNPLARRRVELDAALYRRAEEIFEERLHSQAKSGRSAGFSRLRTLLGRFRRR